MKNFQSQTGLVSQGLITGVRKAAEIVTSTMGASGRNVIIGNSYNELRTTKDGVSVAKSLQFEDPFENIGAQLVISAAKKTVEQVGDGTTATTLLLKELVDKIEIIPDGSINTVISEMETAINKICKYLEDNAVTVEDVEDIQKIATISSSSEYLGELFREVYSDIGTESLIHLEISEHSNDTYYEITEGSVFNSGYVSSVFANKPNGHCSFENAFVHVDLAKHTNMEYYMDIIDKNHSIKRPVVLISPAFSSEFLMLVKSNIARVNVQVCLIKAPGYAQGQIENLKDINALLSEEGTVDKITVTPTKFTIVNTNTPKKAKRVADLKQLRDHAIDDYEKTRFNERIHNLMNTMAIIYAGAVTEEGAKEEYDRIDDALGAVKAAIRSGYVAGGGVALLDAAANCGLDNSRFGEQLIASIASSPMSTILKNASLKNIDKLLKKIKDVDLGYDVSNLHNDNPSPVNVIERGIIDPTEVITNSLKNAFAAFKLILKSDHVIYNKMI